MKTVFYLLLGLLIWTSCEENNIIGKSDVHENITIVENQDFKLNEWNNQVQSELSNIVTTTDEFTGPNLRPACGINWYRFESMNNGCCIYNISASDHFPAFVNGVKYTKAFQISVCEGEQVLVEIRWHEHGVLLCTTILECTCCQEVTADLDSHFTEEGCCLVTVDFDIPNCMANDLFIAGTQYLNLPQATKISGVFDRPNEQYRLTICDNTEAFYINFKLIDVTLDCTYETGFYELRNCVLSEN